MIVFVAAESREFDGLWRHLRNRRRLKWPVQFAAGGELNGCESVLVADGPGPGLASHATEVAGDRVQATCFVSMGFCGGLLPKLRPGTIVVASSIVDESGNVVAATSTPGSRTGRNAAREKMLSVNRVAVTPDEKLKLARSGAGAVEMEAAGVYEMARTWGKPFYGIRVVTDTVQEGFGIDFNRMRDTEGRFSRSRIIREACRQPFKLFPELVQFDRRCRGAAAVLGDFIADCEF